MRAKREQTFAASVLVASRLDSYYLC